MKIRIHPIILILSSLLIMIIGLIFVNNIYTLYYALAIYILCILFGMYKNALKMLIPASIFISIFVLIIYLSTKDYNMMLRMTIRFIVIFVSLIPASSIYIVDFTTSLNQLHVPRFISLGLMITFSFIPILGTEMKRIREAMRSRGITNVLSIKVIYRAFLIPLITRIVDISDILSLSIEARGFKMNDNNYSIYKPVKLHLIDLFYSLLIISLTVLLILFVGVI